MSSLRFATFTALDAFLGEFSGQLRRVGSIDPETLDQVGRAGGGGEYVWCRGRGESWGVW